MDGVEKDRKPGGGLRGENPRAMNGTWMARDRREALCQLGEKNSQKEASMFSQMDDDTNAWEAVSDKQVLRLVGRCAH